MEEALEMIELEKKRAFIEEKELSQLKSEMADYEEDIVDFKQVSKLVGESDRLITKSFPLFWLASKPLQNRTSFFRAHFWVGLRETFFPISGAEAHLRRGRSTQNVVW